MEWLQIIDLIAGLVVIYCVWTGFKIKRDWIIYAIACAVYIFIGIVSNLHGLVVLNIFAAILATKHAIKK